MKALLRKDFYETLSSLRMVLAMMAGGVVLAVLSPQSMMVIPYLIVVPGSIGTTLVALDDANHWNPVAAMMPVTRRQTVTARYLFSMIMIAVGAAAGVIAGVIGSHGSSLKDALSAFALYFGGGMLLPSLSLPVSYGFGSEKGRYVMMFIMILGTMAYINYTDELAAATALGAASGSSLLALAAGLLAFAVSCFVSVRVFEKKELYG